MTTLYPPSRSSVCIFTFTSLSLYIVTKKKKKKKKEKKTTRGLPWVKISKVMPKSQKSISPGKGRDTLRQKVQIFWLKYGTAQPYTFVSSFFKIYNLQAKFFKFTFVFWQNFQRIMLISHNSPQNPANDTKFAPFIDPLYIILSDA